MVLVTAVELRLTYVVTAASYFSSSSRFLIMIEISFDYGADYLSVSNSAKRIICIVLVDNNCSKLKGKCLRTHITRVFILCHEVSKCQYAHA
jgi:hypothetical protein